MQVLVPGNLSRGETPGAVGPLDDEVERAVHGPVEPPDVSRGVGGALPAAGQDDGLHVLGGYDLGVLADADGGVAQQAAHDAVLAAEGVADEQLVVPGGAALAVVGAELAGDGAAALAHLEVPLDAPRRVGLVVDARDEGRVEPLLEALLVEEEGVLERVQLAGQQGRAREDQAGSDVVGCCCCYCRRCFRRRRRRRRGGGGG